VWGRGRGKAVNLDGNLEIRGVGRDFRELRYRQQKTGYMGQERKKKVPFRGEKTPRKRTRGLKRW